MGLLNKYFGDYKDRDISDIRDLIIYYVSISIIPIKENYSQFDIPIIETVTPALWLARFAHLNEVCANAISWPVWKINGHRIETCCPWQTEFVATKAATALVRVP